MGGKIKPRQQKRPRNGAAHDMIMNGIGKNAGPMRDRRKRRPKDKRNSWENDHDAS